MRAEREREVGQAFVSMASTLANGYDVVDLLTELTSTCARLLDISSAGLLLADSRGALRVVAASSERARQLEVFQVQRDDGPCRDCFLSGSPVAVADLEQASDRWPQFVPAARAAGFASVHAVPMRLRAQTLGALGLFGTAVGELNADDLALGQALADVASVALVQERAAADHAAVNEQLHTALSSRVLVEQAKGMLAQVGGLDMPDAFAVLRGYTRDHNARLTDVAQALVSRSLPTRLVLEHRAHSHGSRAP